MMNAFTMGSYVYAPDNPEIKFSCRISLAPITTDVQQRSASALYGTGSETC